MNKNREIRVFLKGQAKEVYLKLKTKKDKQSKIILKSLKRTKQILKQNPQHGQPISRRLIPKKLLKLGITNLYRIELLNFWRMLYTIEGNKIEILLFVIKIINHKEYNKLFGYKNK